MKIILSGLVGEEITASNVRSQLNAAAGADIDVHLSSIGGLVSGGLEIYNLFQDYRRDHPLAQMTLSLKGEVASMASYLAANPAFNQVQAEDNSVFMIHNAHAVVAGDHRDMRTMGAALDGVSGIMAKAYSLKSKKSESEIRQLMDDETWYFGAEIMSAGFADSIIPATMAARTKSQAIATARINFSAISGRIDGKNDVRRIAAMVGVSHQSAASAPAAAQAPAKVALGVMKDGSPLNAAYIKGHPGWKDEISFLTAEGDAFMAATLECEFQMKLSSDGILRTDEDFENSLRVDKGKLSSDGIIRNDADIEAVAKKGGK